MDGSALDDDLLRTMRGIVGVPNVTRDDDLLAPWLTDWRGRYVGRARAMVSPASIAEVAAVVDACHRAGAAIVSQGGNTGMVGGATPDRTGRQVLLSTRRLTDLSIHDEGTARCGAGVVLQTLHDAADEKGWRFPLSLGGKGSATVGGLISTNAGGTQVLRHGTMRSLITGLEAVLPDGRVFRSPDGLRKDNRGFDLKQLFIGSEGTLGIVTGATLRLVPAIGARRTVWAGVDSLGDARRLLLLFEQRLGTRLEGFEVLPQQCLDNAVAYLPGARPPLAGRHRWHCLVECVESERTHSQDLEADVLACLTDAVGQGLIDDAVIAQNEVQAEAFWALRENIAAAEKAAGPAVQHDLSVAPELMPAAVATLSEGVMSRFPGHTVAAFGHLGDGNIHFHVKAPRDAVADWSRSVAPSVSAFVYDEVTRRGGSISAEHGIGQDKLDTLQRTHDPVALDLMRRVKDALDPSGLLNPGKLVPLAPTATSS